MKIIRLVGFLVFTKCFINSCVLLPEDVPQFNNTCFIEMTDDLKIMSVELFESDTLTYSMEFIYSDTDIIVHSAKKDSLLLSKAVYFLNDSLAYLSVDTTYYNSELVSIKKSEYTYDDAGYISSEIVYSKNMSSLTDEYSIIESLEYKYEGGNLSRIVVDDICQDLFEYTADTNIINISSFLGGYCGKLNKNLTGSYYTNCTMTPSTEPAKHEYSYELDGDGFVKKKTEMYTSSYHVADETDRPYKKKIVTSYIYTFLN